MARILMRRGQGLKTPQLGRRVSKFSDEARRFVTSKTPVTRLQRRAPAEALTDERYAKQFTNNPNLKYQPTGYSLDEPSLQTDAGAPGVTKVRVPLTGPVGGGAGHGKTIKKPAKRWKRGRLS
jgi:hypothetical protein